MSLPDVMMSPQLEGSVGGSILESRALIMDKERSTKAWTRGAKRLLDALQRGSQSQHLALPLLLLTAQQRQVGRGGSGEGRGKV